MLEYLLIIGFSIVCLLIGLGFIRLLVALSEWREWMNLTPEERAGIAAIEEAKKQAEQRKTRAQLLREAKERR